MRWRAEQRPTVIVFHAAAVLHNRHPVSQLADDAQVMSDKQQPHVQLLLQLAQQLQNLRLHRYVGAVVGSSAISSSGRVSNAMAIITRWRSPPES